jgi:hypothetical protein
LSDQWTPSGPLTPADEWGSTCGCAPAGGPSSADNVVITGSPGAITSAPGGKPLWSFVLNDGTPAADFRIDRYSDAGVLVDSPMAISRATGVVTFNDPVMLDGDPVEPLEAATKAYVDAIAGGIPDAPNDGTSYVRNSAAWAPFGGPYLPLIGGTVANLTVANVLTVLGSNSVVLNALTTGQQRAILAQQNGANRWQMILADSTAESGGDTGSNFSLYPIADSGTMKPAAFSILRATGKVTFGTMISLPGGANGQVLSTDGAGSLAWATPAAGASPSTTPPLPSGVAAVGTATTYARADHVHPTDAYPHDNRIINGDMRIDQRNGGVSGTATGYTVDRWFYGASQASKGTWQKGVAGANLLALGFPNFLSFTSSSAYAVLTTDAFSVRQPIEADMVSDFAWGTANAQPVTLSFLAMSSLAGTFGGAISNAAPGTRSCPFSFTLAANTWTKIAVTIPGDPTSGWTLNGNGVGAVVWFDLGSGANFRAAAGAWAAGDIRGATGAVSVVGTNAATFYVTGVKLEVGAVATPFNRQSLAKSLADCQRYFQGRGTHIVGGAAISGAGINWNYTFQTAMRAAPTLVFNMAGGSGYASPAAANIVADGFSGTCVANAPQYVANTNYTASAEL